MVSRFDSITIDGLFGKKEPVVIEFADKNDPVKILYGVNGSGKTTIMKIIQHSYCWNPVELFKLPFESITYRLNKRGKYKEKTTINQTQLKCEMCGHKSTISPSGKTSEQNLTLEEMLAGKESSSPKLFVIGDNKIPCPVCENDNIATGFDFTINVDELIRKLVDEINQTINEFEEIKTKLEKSSSETQPKSAELNVKQRLGKIDISVKVKKGKNNIERKAEPLNHSNLKMQAKNTLHHVEKLFKKLSIILSKKFAELPQNESDYSDYRTGNHWGDGLYLEDKKGNIELILDREFDFNTKLKITKKTETPEEIYFGYDFYWRSVDVGNYLHILEERDPILEFDNPLINDILSLMNKINLMRSPSLSAESLDWGFTGLFDTRSNEISVRMPDIHDYWDSDWDKIEQKLTEYRITRFGENPNQRLSVEDWIEVYNAFTNEQIAINDFLAFHLPSDLVAHSKKGTRKRPMDLDAKVKEYSPEMRTPKLVSDFFDYQQVLISPGFGNYEHRNREQYYVKMPKILNISTERKNDDEYFNHFSTNYNRIIQTCSKLLNSLMLKVNGGYKLEPSFSEEYGGPIFHSSDLIHHLSTNHNISMEQFVETIMQEIPGALDNHEIDVEGLMKFIQKEDLEHGHNSSSCLQSGEIAEVISSVVKFCEVIKLKRYLSKTFTHIVFDLENSKIYTDKDRNHSLKFSDLSSGIRQKFRIFTSMAMQVISADKSLILIDEPEISLHLSWQRTFVDDLTEFLIDLVSKSRITVDGEDELQNIISVLISTHSPAVLANHYHRGQKIGESDLFEE